MDEEDKLSSSNKLLSATGSDFESDFWGIWVCCVGDGGWVTELVFKGTEVAEVLLVVAVEDCNFGDGSGGKLNGFQLREDLLSNCEVCIEDGEDDCAGEVGNEVGGEMADEVGDVCALEFDVGELIFDVKCSGEEWYDDVGEVLCDVEVDPGLEFSVGGKGKRDDWLGDWDDKLSLFCVGVGLIETAGADESVDSWLDEVAGCGRLSVLLWGLVELWLYDVCLGA